jgi:hypothetical protein
MMIVIRDIGRLLRASTSMIVLGLAGIVKYDATSLAPGNAIETPRVSPG